MEYIFYYLVFSFVFVNFLSFHIYGNIINCVSLFSFGINFSLFSYLILYFFEKNIESNFLNFNEFSINNFYYVALTNLCSLLFFSIPTLFVVFLYKIKNFNFPINIENNGLFYFVLIISILFVFIFCLLYGGIPIFGMSTNEINVEDYNESLKNSPFGLLSIINLFSIVYALCFAKRIVHMKIQRKNFIFLFVILLFLAFWQGKRQLLLVFLMFLFLFYSMKIKLSLTKSVFLFLKVSIILFLAFILIDYLRYGGDKSDYSSIFGYMTWPVMNMASVLDKNNLFFGDESSNILFLFNDVIPSRFLSRDSLDILKSRLYEPTSPSGLLMPLWFSGGLVAIALFSLIFGFICVLNYVLYKKYGFLDLYILCLWCCITSGVYSHFLSNNFFIFPYVFMIVSYFFRSQSIKNKF